MSLLRTCTEARSRECADRASCGTCDPLCSRLSAPTRGPPIDLIGPHSISTNDNEALDQSANGAMRNHARGPLRYVAPQTIMRQQGILAADEAPISSNSAEYRDGRSFLSTWPLAKARATSGRKSCLAAREHTRRAQDRDLRAILEEETQAASCGERPRYVTSARTSLSRSCA
jgi:hypothetical protein